MGLLSEWTSIYSENSCPLMPDANAVPEPWELLGVLQQTDLVSGRLDVHQRSAASC